MYLTPNETAFLLWVCAAMLGVIVFIAVLAINTFLKMGKDIGEIKAKLMLGDSKHEGFERRISYLEFAKNKN